MIKETVADRRKYMHISLFSLLEKNVPDKFHDTLARAMVSLHHLDHEETGLSVLTLGELKTSMIRF